MRIFPHFHFFRLNHFSRKEKIYKKDSQFSASKNCPNYSTLVQNRYCGNLKYSLHYISFRVILLASEYENEGGGLTQMLIKSHRNIISTDHGFHLKGEQYRQFLEPICGPYLQQTFFLLEKCLVQKMKMHENEGGWAHSDANKISQRHDID